MLTAADVLGLLILAAAAVLLYLIYALNRPDPGRAAREEGERADRSAREARAYEESEKKRLFAIEMAKLGYVQKPVMQREVIEEQETDYGGTLTDTTREWQLAWVKDEAKAQAVLET